MHYTMYCILAESMHYTMQNPYRILVETLHYTMYYTMHDTMHCTMHYTIPL